MSKENILVFISGLIFSLGLIISEMINPEKVINFLLVGRAQWDISLAFVMGGALITFIPIFYWAQKRGKTLFNKPLKAPVKGPITKQLVIGSVLFGIGWGLLGLCPGPAFLRIATLQSKELSFIAFMFLGFYLARHEKCKI